ncbi:DNA replication-like protein [Candidatus Nitromaritima sp. SCGC AAA799-C22]|nr:DNA replication-like protein [Candidatus Nitromaritima sp. SCGC AAA799-C22]
MTSTKTQPKVCRKCWDRKYVFSTREGKLRTELCACFHCEECDGEGRVFRQDDRGIAFLSDCSRCAVLRSRLRLLNDAGIPGKFASSTLDNYKPVDAQNKKALSRAKDFLDDVIDSPGEPHRGLLFMGGPGQGKTHLVVSILKHLILEAGIDGKFVDFFQLLSDIRHAYSEEQSEKSLIEPYLKSKVLVIDELAKGRNNEWELTILDQFISSRYNAADKITLFTTNYTDQKVIPSESDKRTTSFPKLSLQEKVDDRIFSRLTEMCDFIKMEGADYRAETRPSRKPARRKSK